MGLRMCCWGEPSFIFPGTWVLSGRSARRVLKKDCKSSLGDGNLKAIYKIKGCKVGSSNSCELRKLEKILLMGLPRVRMERGRI